MFPSINLETAVGRFEVERIVHFHTEMPAGVGIPPLTLWVDNLRLSTIAASTGFFRLRLPSRR